MTGVQTCALPIYQGSPIAVELNTWLSATSQGFRLNVIIQDIRQRQAIEQALRDSQQRLQTITDNLPVLIAYVDRQLRYQFNNATYTLWYQWPVHELQNRPLQALFPDDEYARMLPFMQQALAGQLQRFERTEQRADGLHYLLSIYIPHEQGEQVLGFYVLTQDITHRKQLEIELEQHALFDALTGLPNRRALTEQLPKAMARSSRTGQTTALLFMDLDGFKAVNDTYGHDAGDELLTVLAGHIKSSIRSHNDVVARFGGDEFCILINIHHRDEARHMAQRIMQKMKEPIELAGRRMVMTTSIGISVFPEDGTTCEELLKTADLALYQSKDGGRNSLNFFSSNLKTRAFLELQLEEELRSALRNQKELVLHYQPILDLHKGKVTRLEALVRWQHPQHGLLAPERFIGIAENNGLIAELDNWVLRQACADLGWLTDQGHPELVMAVNCSALNLARDELADEIEYALRSSGIAASRLELEVTENALMGNISSTLILLRQIRALGVALSIDDFGTGYSSLSYLKRLPLNTLKIDRSFIQDIPKSTTDMEIVQAIIGMAHTLHLQVITEGVETQQQLELLIKHGCDYVQGYLLSAAVPASEISAVIKALDQRNPPGLAGSKDTTSAKGSSTGSSVVRPIR